MIETIDFRDGKARIIDQTLLPLEEKILSLSSADEMADSIRSLKVRGAPAIGIAAAYGVLLELEAVITDVRGRGASFDRSRREGSGAGIDIDLSLARERLSSAAAMLAATRPTAVNLFRALDRMMSAIERDYQSPASFCEGVAKEAFAIHEEQLEIEKRLGKNGATLISDGMTVLTHCNAGGLATAGYGTALGVIYAAAELGKRVKVFAGETRPLLQGARLTAWELSRNGIDTTVICDGATHSLISSRKVDMVITGADRIARNGDTANKIGTLGLAVSCERFGVPFYIAAPLSTFDPGTPSGAEIEIELRSPMEVECFHGIRVVPKSVGASNPAFDVTPSTMISGFITEKGIIKKPFGAEVLEPRDGWGGGRGRPSAGD